MAGIRSLNGHLPLLLWPSGYAPITAIHCHQSLPADRIMAGDGQVGGRVAGCGLLRRTCPLALPTGNDLYRDLELDSCKLYSARASIQKLSRGLMLRGRFGSTGLPVNIMRTGARGGGITRALRLLTIAVIVVPVVLFATAAWINYVGAFREARERVI